MNALFVYDPNDLEASISGGVQKCTKEFLAVVEAASDSVTHLPIRPTRRFSWRLRRRLGLGGYLGYDPSDLPPALLPCDGSISHVFLNRSELIRLGPCFRNMNPSPKIIVMSHGNQSGDDLYEIAGTKGRRTRGLKRWSETWKLGQNLVTESSFRHSQIDAVCAMSEEECVLERWLGAKLTFWIPRVVTPQWLTWRPTPQRVGYVGTLDHTPNQVALRLLGNELKQLSLPSEFEIRLIGGPESIGHELATDYKFINYLGRLDDSQLEAEASSWSLFLNPIFWLSRGASMKLGQALAWGVPSISTISGVRGYKIPSDAITLSGDNPRAFAELLTRSLASADILSEKAQKLKATSSSWPTAASLGKELRNAFGAE